MFCFCSNEMQPCRIWGAKQKLNPIANNPRPYTFFKTICVNYIVNSCQFFKQKYAFFEGYKNIYKSSGYVLFLLQ